MGALMNHPFEVLLLSAFTLGVFHTAIGIDHSLPFVVLARTRGWSLRWTLAVTFFCGVGHVLSSVLIAGVGLGLGVAGSRLSFVEETRGSWAAWLLVGFGLAYATVAYLKSGARPREGGEGRLAGHVHLHGGRPLELADAGAMTTRRLLPSLFVVFLLGPCEALLPLLTASGMTISLSEGAIVTLTFCAATISTMLFLVTLGFYGAAALRGSNRTPLGGRYAHSLAGLALAASGMSIQVLGI